MADLIETHSEPATTGAAAGLVIDIQVTAGPVFVVTATYTSPQGKAFQKVWTHGQLPAGIITDLAALTLKVRSALKSALFP